MTDQDIQFKFRVCGTASLSINVEVEGADAGDAECNVEMADVSPDVEGVGCDYCAISRFECNETVKLHKVEEDEDEPIYKFRVEGSMEVEVHLDVMAGTYQEALEEIESMDWNFGDDLTVLSCEQDGWEFDEDSEENCNLHEKKWDDHMSHMERMQFLIGLGISDDCAYEIAGRDGQDVPSIWLSKLEV